MGKLKDWLSEISLPVYILVMLFAVSSWIDINGVWVELPLLVNELPESWSLPSYLTLISQIANVGPIAYTIAIRYVDSSRLQISVIYTIIAVGAVACMLLAFLWQETTFIGGTEHSTALLVLTGFLALVDCTSSVAFLPYMAMYKPQYMSGYYIGEGLSGLLPGLVSLIQGLGGDPTCVNETTWATNETTGENYTEYAVYPVYDPPLFPVRDFMIFLFSMICLSGLAFSLLHYMPYCQRQRLPVKAAPVTHAREGSEGDLKAVEGKDGDGKGDSTADSPVKMAPAHKAGEVFTLTDMTSKYSGLTLSEYSHVGSKVELITPSQADKYSVGGGSQKEKHELSRGNIVYVLIMTGWACCLTNTVLPSIGSYACLPYGDMAYTLAVRLSSVANPVACLIALFLPSRSLVLMGVLSLMGSGLMGYQLFLAAASPDPPLEDTDAGVALVVVTQILLVGFLSYVKVSAAILMNDSGGRKGLLWVGGVTQIGSFIGAVVTFLVINVYELLESEFACSG